MRADLVGYCRNVAIHTTVVTIIARYLALLTASKTNPVCYGGRGGWGYSGFGWGWDCCGWGWGLGFGWAPFWY
ncbi:MAG TPA: hypothetical protein VFF50_11590 [Candidatus Deferrimicrobiaceae bacterium]|nr:hypothetical protein [Candidatus Deferrimicrobiaceae bacterium]